MSVELNNPLLINAVEMVTDSKGRPVAALYHGNLKYAALRCDPAMLAAAGIDPAGLSGRTPAAIMATWEESPRRNANGIPYKNVLTLAPATAAGGQSDADGDTIARLVALVEVMAQRLEHVEALLMQSVSEEPPTSGIFDYFYANGDGVESKNAAEVKNFNEYRRQNGGRVPNSRGQLRAWYKAKNAPAPPAAAVADDGDDYLDELEKLNQELFGGGE